MREGQAAEIYYSRRRTKTVLQFLELLHAPHSYLKMLDRKNAWKSSQ